MGSDGHFCFREIGQERPFGEGGIEQRHEPNEEVDHVGR